MRIIQSIPQMSKWAEGRRSGATIGFVPTMGALHEGHLSLMRAARRRCDAVVVSIFVNPAQFGPNEDYARYPRDAKGDAALCRREKAALLFRPEADAVYPKGHATRIRVGRIGEILEGAFRPGHFSGVATVVAKLFQIVRPDVAFFGQKDYQQTVVIRQLVRDLNFPVRIVVSPTVRENDGLALSSRNRYLSAEERKAALVLFRALQIGRAQIDRGERDAGAVREAMALLIQEEPLARIDYVAIVHPDTLSVVGRIEGPVVLLLAVWIGKTRLIDNALVKP
ncbi:MAG TPA: pantoate--beta-alanine ligase [Nitrospiria bacterium]|jgi:pantoate--beta-alanine ligase|nr:pantoate--beta-alanine ligase [Nitrospiria bacterium]